MTRIPAILLLATACVSGRTAPPPVAPLTPPAQSAPAPAPQNPSPMSDSTRAHERVVQREVAGERFSIDAIVAKPVEVLRTRAAARGFDAELVIHFHGAAFIPMQAAEESGRPLVVAVVNAGAGGGLYDRVFSDPDVYRRLVSEVERISGVRFAHRYLSGFSAGYGAIRAILRNEYESVDGVLLLDGLHTGYIPERTPIAEGGKLEEASLEPFRRFARDAAAGKKRFVVTHSEIFPGTFASTTETTDDLLRAAGMRRRPVLQWGPLGMQQLSETRLGSFVVMGFAGNSAPDHVDHLHAYAYFLARLLE